MKKERARMIRELNLDIINIGGVGHLGLLIEKKIKNRWLSYLLCLSEDLLNKVSIIC